MPEQIVLLEIQQTWFKLIASTKLLQDCPATLEVLEV